MPTTFITGAAGFIGSHLSQRLLDRGHQVVGVDNFNDFYDPSIKRERAKRLAANGAFTMQEADIRDGDAMLDIMQQTRPESVVHLAAMAGVRPSIADPGLYVDVNLNGTTRVLEAAAQSGVQRVLFASSSSVYGNNEKVPFAETDAVDHPISPYAATKRAGELICNTYSHLHDLPISCLRFFTVFGPDQRPDLAIHKFMRCALEGRTITMFGDGSSSRDYTFIDDIVSGIEAAFAHDRGCRIFNLGGNKPVSLLTLIETIERVTGKSLAVDRQPMQPGDVNRTFADLQRSGAELGYAPKTSLEEGMTAQWDWMCHNEAAAADRIGSS